MHLSAGDLLRAERDTGSPDAKLINDLINAGAIVPVKITVQLIKKAMKKAGWAKKRFLIDGFPRNEENYLGFDDVMGGDVNMEKVLFFEADEETLV